MKRIVCFIIVLAMVIQLPAKIIAHSNPTSGWVQVNIDVSIPPLLKVIPNTLQFIDENQNGAIDANENCKIRFKIKNDGKGKAYDCTTIFNAIGTKNGLIINDVQLPIISAGEERWVEIPIKANEYTQNGTIQFSVVVNEPKGFGTDPIKGTIHTHKLKTPYVQVASYKVVGNKGGKLNRKEPFKLQILVQNTDQGIAKDVSVRLRLPTNVHWQDGIPESFNIGTLNPNDKKILEYELIANPLATDKIDIGIDLNESTSKYAQDATIPLQFGQYVGSSIAMNVKHKEDKDVVIQKASLISDVDENIPITNTRNENTFVLIIANENYEQVASVPFAYNDGKIFREYCLKTLGINSKHIRYAPDATLNNIKSEINWLKNITETWKESQKEPQVIIYYAGHGIPNESNKSAYLLPVDGSGTDVSTGYKLDELYATLGNMPASQITVFMDACFSGSKREEGMLASARGVALKARTGVPKGNMVVFSAAQGDETAYPNNEQQHGLFTYYLLKKLQETKGNITLKALGDYVIQEVKQQSLILNSKKQTPCVTPSATLDDEWQYWKLK